MKDPFTESIGQYVSWAAGFLAVIGAIIGLIGVIWNPKLTIDPPVQREEVQEIKAQISTLSRSVASVESKLSGLSSTPDQNMISAQLKGMESSSADLTARFSKIEGLIIQDPAKALEIPLLRKDMEVIRDSNQLSITSLRQDLERAYSLLVGTMVALVIAVFAPLVSGIFGKKATAK